MLYRKPAVSCAASGAGLRKLRVEVDDPNAPLQLGVDESYSISVTRRGAVIRAATRVGGSRGGAAHLPKDSRLVHTKDSYRTLQQHRMF